MNSASELDMKYQSVTEFLTWECCAPIKISRCMKAVYSGVCMGVWKLFPGGFSVLKAAVEIKWGFLMHKDQVYSSSLAASGL